jgi:hypothetical protein
MKAFTGKVAIFLSIFIFTSCFEIKEILNLRKDGTGTYEFIVDMSQSAAMLSMLDNLSTDSVSEEDDSPFGEVDKSFDDTKERLEAIEGIINVKSIKNEEDLLFGISFEFLTIYALNKALNRINADKDEQMSKEKEKIYFSMSKRTFQRYNTENFTEDLFQGAGLGEASVTVGMFFNDFSYSTKYTMPKKIKSMTNPDAELSKDKRTASVTYYPFRGEGEPNFSNKIKF